MLGAAVDVGSNTVRLLIGETQAGRVLPHRYERRITRLAGGYDPDRGLSNEATSRTLEAVCAFLQTARDYPIEGVRLVGTAALRQAVNGAAFGAEVFAASGYPLEIITGDEEARLCAAGARTALDPLPNCYLLFDIGGGSTEFILQRGEETIYHRSFPLGVVSLVENREYPIEMVIRNILSTLRDDLVSAGFFDLVENPETVLVGTAGTVTTLAAMQLRMTDYDWRRINNARLDRAQLAALRATIAALVGAARLRLPGLEKGREDLILPGADIVLGILDLFGKRVLKVSDFGLLEGTLLSLSAPR